MSNNAAPDSWEEAELTDSSASDLQQKLTKLNVNAAEFVPSFSFPSKSDGEDDHEGGDLTDGGGEKKQTTASKCCDRSVLRL